MVKLPDIDEMCRQSFVSMSLDRVTLLSMMPWVMCLGAAVWHDRERWASLVMVTLTFDVHGHVLVEAIWARALLMGVASDLDAQDDVGGVCSHPPGVFK